MLPGHSLTATGNEVSCPRVSPVQLFSVDEIALCAQMQMTNQLMSKCPEVCIISFTFYYCRNHTSEYQ